MNNNNPRLHQQIIIIGFVLAVGVSCALLLEKIIIYFEGEILIDDYSGYFTISPKNILTDLSAGLEGDFIPSDTPPHVSFPNEGDPVRWDIDDYMLIAHRVNEMFEKDSPGDWEFNMISGDWDCEHIDYGPQSAHFRMFKVYKTKKESFRMVNSIRILPRRNSIIWYIREESPVLFNWAVIDPRRLNISMGEAVEIAEENGGKETRAEEIDQCSLHVLYNPDGSFYGGWRVEYQNAISDRLDLYLISPETGEVKNSK